MPISRHDGLRQCADNDPRAGNLPQQVRRQTLTLRGELEALNGTAWPAPGREGIAIALSRSSVACW